MKKSKKKVHPNHPKKKSDEKLKARSQMLHEVHKAAAKGSVHDEGFEIHDSPEEEANETPEQEAAEQKYSKGGRVCMYCGGKMKAK